MLSQLITMTHLVVLVTLMILTLAANQLGPSSCAFVDGRADPGRRVANSLLADDYG